VENPGKIRSDHESVEITAWVFPPGHQPDLVGKAGEVGGLRARLAGLDADQSDALIRALAAASPASTSTESSGVVRPAEAGPLTAVQRVEVLGSLCERFLDPDDPLRNRALGLLPANAALSHESATQLLDRMAADWTRERLRKLLELEFPDTRPGEGFGVPEGGDRSRVSIPIPSPLVLTICSGTVPGVSVTAALRALLVGSSVILKPGAGDIALPLLFAEALGEECPQLAAQLAVVYWQGGGGALEEAALQAADRVVVYGGTETIASIRARAHSSAQLVEYGHRVGLAVVGVDHEPPRLSELADEVVEAVVPYEQRGCVSPVRVIAVGSADRGREFAQALAIALERRSAVQPGVRTPAEAAEAHQLRTTLELRAAAGEEVTQLHGDGWLVTLDDGATEAAGGRVVPVIRVPSVLEVELRFNMSITGDGRRLTRSIPLQAVGISGFSTDVESALAERAAHYGASRISPVREMAWPPAWWRQEGRGPLRALVSWAEWDRGNG